MSLQHSDRKSEVLHCVGRRRRESAIPRLQKLIDDAAKAAAPIPNATTMDANDRAASTQLFWMMLTICMGAALNISAWEREIATYERDSGKIFYDETKVGAVLLRMPESQLKPIC